MFLGKIPEWRICIHPRSEVASLAISLVSGKRPGTNLWSPGLRSLARRVGNPVGAFDLPIHTVV